MSTQAAAPQLRPLGIGEILDVGIKIYFRNAWTLFRLVLFVVLPAQILVNLVQVSALPAGMTGTFSSPEHPATPDWPSNSDCAAFVPSMSLLPATTYRARFKFKAAAEPLVTSFTTRGKR